MVAFTSGVPQQLIMSFVVFTLFTACLLAQLSSAATLYSQSVNGDNTDKRAAAAGPAAWDMHAWGKRAWGDLQAWGKRSPGPNALQSSYSVDADTDEAELQSLLQALAATTRARRAKVGDWQNFSGWGRR